MNEKQDIILKYIRDGKSQRKISKETRIFRETIRKYVKEYESKLQEVNGNLDEIHKIDIINDITNSPKYTVANRYKRVVTDEVIERIKFYLKENEQKGLRGDLNNKRRELIFTKHLLMKALALAIRQL